MAALRPVRNEKEWNADAPVRNERRLGTNNPLISGQAENRATASPEEPAIADEGVRVPAPPLKQGRE
ncbi:MAG: hypothetical protein M3449_05955 [Acidobacteriota bacterium]|nr:hypothetical protein [Acidobacteriota bacterium]MDQ3490592.1 hypothetical protein [Acidobacteriota bacterium]